MKIVIQGEFCTLNEYIYAERSNRYAAANIKKTETKRVAWEAKVQAKENLEPPYYLKFKWFSNNRRKDPDNIVFGKKFLLDGLKKAGVIENDTWKYIAGFSDEWEVDKENPRVEIEISSVEPGSNPSD